MGGGVSSLARARKIVVIRAYNARAPDQTVSEQFDAFSVRNSEGVKVLRTDDVKNAIGLTQPWFDELLLRIAGDTLGEVVFDSFVDFLETGRVPPEVPMVPAPAPAKQTLAPLPPRPGRSTPKESDRKAEAQRRARQLEFNDTLKPIEHHPHTPAVARRFVRDCVADASAPFYPDVLKCLGFKEPTSVTAILPHRGTTLSRSAKDSYKRPGPARPLWRKRETVVQERIVQYTTIDADGTVQELVESERSQNEIVHLECKDTGEFAHRESAEYEQMETFNNEVVVEERGNEEYLHLKSKDDEYEHLESNMPKTRQQRAEEEAAAAAQAEAEAAAAAAAAGQASPQLEHVGPDGQWYGQPPEGMDPSAFWQMPDGAKGEGSDWWHNPNASPGGPFVDMENMESGPYAGHMGADPYGQMEGMEGAGHGMEDREGGPYMEGTEGAHFNHAAHAPRFDEEDDEEADFGGWWKHSRSTENLREDKENAGAGNVASEGGPTPGPPPPMPPGFTIPEGSADGPLSFSAATPTQDLGLHCQGGEQKAVGLQEHNLNHLP